MQVLPLLRRTFANFTIPKEGKLGRKVRQGGTAGQQHNIVITNFDPKRAKQGLPVIMQLLGLTIKTSETNGN
jgi:hypothetical protein